MPGKAQDPIGSADRLRLVWMVLGILAFFSLLIAQFYKIQIIEGAKWSREARRQHYFIVQEPFLRGTFYSNTSLKQGNPETPQKFVIDIQKYHLYIDPESIPEKNRAFISKQISTILELTSDEQKELRKQFDKKCRSRKLSMWLDRDTREQIMLWWQPYARKHKIVRNALFFVNDYQRSYPFGKLLGQVLHTVQNQKDEVTKQSIPTGGLELYFDGYLKGKQGRRRLMRSPRNSLETGEVIEAPENGADIYLTINHCLQAIVEEELEKGVKKCKAKGGWAVMMDPKTGEILALAQYPFFYPPDYQYYFNDPEMIEHTRLKAVTDANEPGSVIKPFTMCAGLMANGVLRKRGEPPLFNPEEKTAASNGHFQGRSRPLNDTHTHNFLNMPMALQKSSNVYPARLVEKIISKLGNEWYRNVLANTFGFGKKTHIELPSETPGVMPVIGKRHPNGALEWSNATPYSLAIGYNLQVNSIQMARAYSVLANGGYLVQPTLVRKVVRTRENGEQEVLVDNTDPGRRRHFPRVIDPLIVKEVVTCMKYTTKPGGTAPRADVRGYTEAGKTSTSKKLVDGVYADKLYRSSFAGFTPVADPAFVLLVTMDEPEYAFVPGVGKTHHGGTCAAPVFREISKRSLEYLGITPDDPCGYPVGDPRHDSKKADWALEAQKLRELYQSWNH